MILVNYGCWFFETKAKCDTIGGQGEEGKGGIEPNNQGSWRLQSWILQEEAVHLWE